MKKRKIGILYVVGAAVMIVFAVIWILNSISVGIIDGDDGPTMIYS